MKAPNRRVVGNFRSKGTRLMEPDSRKKFRLLSTDGGDTVIIILQTKEIVLIDSFHALICLVAGFLTYQGTTVHGHLARQFNFWVESRSFKGIPHFFLSFPTKLSLMKFFTSREAKTISHLQIDESLVVDVVGQPQEVVTLSLLPPGSAASAAAAQGRLQPPSAVEVVELTVSANGKATVRCSAKCTQVP